MEGKGVMWTLLLLTVVFSGALALRLTEMQVPEAVRAGEDVVLTCDYNLEGDELYSVKWVLNHVEFYRYDPHHPPYTFYAQVRGLHVDMRRSHEGTVVLQNVHARNSGVYGCVVKTGPPSNSMILAEKRMTVSDGSPPTRQISLEVPDQIYEGREVTLGCDYDLWGEELYNVKWYLDGHEFYRYTPKDIASKRFMAGRGLNVDLEKSGANEVALYNLDVQSSGVYKCEVATGSPYFRLFGAQKRMTVVEVNSVHK